jgi:hypothetical protein
MPTQRTVTVYKFSELNPKAQKQAIEDYQRVQGENFDSKRLTENFAERLDEVGLPSKKVNWSLSSSQGDGVAFYGLINLREYVKKNDLTAKYKPIEGHFMDTSTSIEQKGSHHYNHANSMKLEMEAPEDLTPGEQALFKQLHDHIEEHIKSLSRELEKIGYSEIEYESSEEVAREALSEDEVDFDKDGHRSRY